MLQRNPPKHIRQGPLADTLVAFIHGLTPVAFCEGGLKRQGGIDAKSMQVGMERFQGKTKISTEKGK